MPLMYLESMVDGAMKGMGEQKAVFRYSLWDAVLRIAGVLLLLAQMGDEGLFVGDPAVQCLYLPDEYSPSAACQRLKPRLWRWLGAPALAALVSAGAGEGLRTLLAGWLGSGSTPTRLARSARAALAWRQSALPCSGRWGWAKRCGPSCGQKNPAGSGRKARRIGIVLDTGGRIEYNTMDIMAEQAHGALAPVAGNAGKNGCGQIPPRCKRGFL